MCCTESEVGHDDGRFLSVHSEHIRHHSFCPVCVGRWNCWLVGVVLHCTNVLYLCKSRFFFVGHNAVSDVDYSFSKTTLLFVVWFGNC